MPNPTADSFSAAAGVTFGCGRNSIQVPAIPEGTPLWLENAAVNEWVAIPNTSGADGQPIDAWCDIGIKQSTGEVLIALAGGHDDGWQTRISSISLLADAPAYVRRKESITSDLRNYSQSVNGAPPPNAVSNPGVSYPYCKDGVTPSSRHTRWQTQYCEQNDKIMLMGSPSLYGYGGSSAVASNGFSLATGTWDTPGTWANAPTTSAYGTEIDDIGNIWCRTHKFIRASNTFVALPTSYANTSAFDRARRQLFTLCYGDGLGFSANLGVVAKVIREDLAGWSNITFNASDAYSEFVTLAPPCSGMTYDPIRDRFLFYCGKGISQGVIYVVTPNSGTAWDMSKLTQGSNSSLPTAPPVTGAGTNGRFKYVAALDGVVLLPRRDSNIYFMRLG